MQMKGRGGGGVVHANEGEGRGVSLTASSQFIIMHMVHVISILKLQCAQKRSTRRTATEDDPASVRSCLEFSLIAFLLLFYCFWQKKTVFFGGVCCFCSGCISKAGFLAATTRPTEAGHYGAYCTF